MKRHVVITLPKLALLGIDQAGRLGEVQHVLVVLRPLALDLLVQLQLVAGHCGQDGIHISLGVVAFLAFGQQAVGTNGTGPQLPLTDKADLGQRLENLNQALATLDNLNAAILVLQCAHVHGGIQHSAGILREGCSLVGGITGVTKGAVLLDLKVSYRGELINRSLPKLQLPSVADVINGLAGTADHGGAARCRQNTVGNFGKAGVNLLILPAEQDAGVLRIKVAVVVARNWLTIGISHQRLLQLVSQRFDIADVLGGLQAAQPQDGFVQEPYNDIQQAFELGGASIS